MAEIVLRLPRGSRLACVGRTGTGKSQLARELFLATAGRRVVIDPHDSDLTVGEWPSTAAPAVDFRRSPTWRVVPRDPLDLDFYDRLYQGLFDTGNLLIWSDEANAITTSHQIPLGVRMVLFQGRKRHITHVACSPRPADVHPGIWAQSELWAIFKLPFIRDRQTVAASAGIPMRTFEELQERLGPHGFLWWDGPTDRLLVVEQGLRLPDRSVGAVPAK